MVMGDNKQKCRQIAAAVWCGVHRPMEHIQGYTQSHWMPPSVECLHHIAPAFEWNTQNTYKTQLLDSSYKTFWSLVVCEILNLKTNPRLSSSIWQALLKCETPQLELESSATFLAMKRWQRTKVGKVINLAQKQLKNGHIYAPIGIKLLIMFWSRERMRKQGRCD